MDKKLLGALNNVSEAITLLSETLDFNRNDQAKTATANALQSSDINKQIKSLNLGIKSIQRDTKEILKNQKTIINLSSQKKDDSDTKEILKNQKTLEYMASKKGDDKDTKEILKKQDTILNMSSKKDDKDTKEILKKQDTILNMSKKKDGKDDIISQTGDPKQKKNIKDGVSIILLIATGVLAVGLAFKIIGQVDFVSVVALALALPLVAIAFEKISQMKGLNPKDSLNLAIVMVAISAAIVASSFILSKVQPVGLFQLSTSILIAAMFATVAFGMNKLIGALKGVSPKDVWKLPIIMIAISASILASSFILSKVQPVGLFQLFTSVFIAAMFVTISFGIGKLANSVKGINPMNMWKLPIILIAVSLAIVGSSYILNKVQPVGLFQLFTAVFIAAAFGVIAIGLGKLVEGISKIGDPKKAATIALLLPIVLIGVAAAITGASYLFAMIQPIGLFQFFTAVMIAIVFIPISFALPFISKALEKVDIKRIILLPIMMVAMAGAIWLSSLILSKVQVIPFSTLLNIVAQAVTLAAISLSMAAVMYAFDKFKLTISKIISGGASILIIAGSIALSSRVLSMGEYGKLIPFDWIINSVFSISTFGVMIYTLDKLKLDIDQVISGAASILIIAGSIALTSQILTMGDYTKLIPSNWIINSILSISAFGVLIYAIDVLKLNPVKAIMGAISIVIIAGSISLTSHILSLGKYTKFPSFGWVIGVGLSVTAFGAAAFILGNIAMTGVGAVAMLAGAGMILLIAGSIVATAKILSLGSYGKFPSYDWSLSVGLSMVAFGSGILLLGTFVVGTLGLGGLAILAGSKAVRVVAQSIVDTSIILQKGKFTGGPTVDWSSGIAMALGAFTPIYKMMMKSSIFSLFGGGGIGPDEFAKAIEVVAVGIVRAAELFNGSKVAFVGGPKKEWAEGIGIAIGAFAPVYKALADSSGFFSGGPSPEDMVKGIETISKGIVRAATIFNTKEAKVAFSGGPRKEWSEGIGGAITAFAPVFEFLNKNTGFLTSGDEAITTMKKGIGAIADSIVNVSKKISKGDFSKRIPLDFIKNISDSIKKYLDIVKYLSNSDVDDFDLLEDYADGLVNIADAYGKFASSIGKLNSALGSLDMERISALRSLTGGIILMSLMDADQFSTMMDALEEKAEIFVETVNKLEGDKPSAIEKTPPTTSSKSGASGTSVKVATKEENSMDQILQYLEAINSNLGSIASDARSIQDHIVEGQTTSDVGSMIKQKS